jgi:hypothetical protein
LLRVLNSRNPECGGILYPILPGYVATNIQIGRARQRQLWPYSSEKCRRVSGLEARVQESGLVPCIRCVAFSGIRHPLRQSAFLQIGAFSGTSYSFGTLKGSRAVTYCNNDNNCHSKSKVVKTLSTQYSYILRQESMNMYARREVSNCDNSRWHEERRKE